MVTRRGALVTLALSGAALVLPTAATASVSRAMSVRELTKASRAVLMGEAVEAYSQWETLGQRRRIVTFTRVVVSEGVLGEPESEIMVQTLGGRVGKLGQVVHGEAALRLHEQSLLFIQDSDQGITRVTAMAQGHYRMLPDERGAVRLLPSPRLGTLLPAKAAAVLQLRDRTLPEARDIIVRAYQQ